MCRNNGHVECGEWLQEPRRTTSGGVRTGSLLAGAAASILLLGQGADARTARAPALFRSSSLPELHGTMRGAVRTGRLEDVQLDPGQIPSSFGWGLGTESSAPSSPQGEASGGSKGGGEGYFSASRRFRGIQQKNSHNLRRSLSVRNGLSEESGNNTPSPERVRKDDSFYRVPTQGSNDYTKLQLSIYPEIEHLK
mmetsp:Transcript_49234/g.123072  ORF Transcript_49234/g.123072 Transcript_49234/m.123072 type:complete len:195 (-) Transcript_49234:452-1036(-)